MTFHRAASLPTAYRFPHKDYLSIATLSPDDIRALLDMAHFYHANNLKTRKTIGTLNGLSAFNLFFEDSTRTIASFDAAAKRMGMDTVTLSMNTSSVNKGESALDTARNMDAMQADVLVVRHRENHIVQNIANHVQAAVINAGDGTNEHPTQALLDALTIELHRPHLAGLVITICGDLLHSRVAHSNYHLLSKMGAHVRFCAPSRLMPNDHEFPLAERFDDFDKAINGADIIYMLRIQKERMHDGLIENEADYIRHYGLNEKRLAAAKPDALVMHPGPMNRGIEIDNAVADHATRSLILQQAGCGVAARMAILDAITQNRRIG